MLSLLIPILCNFCITTTPDGFQYFNGQGSYYTDFSTSRSDITYGYAAGVVRSASPTSNSHTVAGQFNAHGGDGVFSTTFGVATEAVGLVGAKGPLVGIEALVANYGDDHTAPKVAVNAVYKSYYGNANTNSTAFFVSAYNTIWAQNGFETGIKFDRVSLKASPNRAAAVIDLSEIPLEDLKNMDLIKLPNGKSLRWTGNELKLHSVD